MKNSKFDADIEYLYKGIITLDDPEDCKNFFEDLCTVSELQEMSRRIKAARMLSDGYVYSEIATQTGLSTATISRVNHCIKYGNGGYSKVLESIKLEEKKHK